MDKKKTVMSILIGLILISSLFSLTYAYFGVTQTNTTSNQVVVTTGGVTIVLDDVDPISQEDKIDANNTSITRYLKITNESIQDAYINILFKDLVNTFVTNDLTYTLEEVQGDKSSFENRRILVDKEVVPKSSTAANTALARGVLINKGTQSTTVTPHIQYYKLTINYNYRDDVNQDVDLNKVLTSEFIIEEGSPQRVTLTFNIGEDATIESNTMDAFYTSTYSNLPTPVKSGKRFGGWYLDAAYTNEVLSSSIILKPNTELYAKWEDIVIKCVDDNGTEIACPNSHTLGDRIKIGTEYFRYIRTTDSTSMLNECGNTGVTGGNGARGTPLPCKDTSTDTNSVIKVGAGYLRFIAEWNLAVTYDSSRDDKANNPKYYVAPSATQYQDTGNTCNPQSKVRIRYDRYSGYNGSELQTYMNNYATKLNNDYFSASNIITANALTIHEAASITAFTIYDQTYFDLPSWMNIKTPNCNAIWLSSPRDYEYHSGLQYYGRFEKYTNASEWPDIADKYGPRPVIEMSEENYRKYS